MAGESLRYSLWLMQQVVKTQQESRLTLAEILDWMLEDKMVDAESAEKLKKERRYYRGTMHPLVIVADQKWKKVSGAGHSLWTLDALTEWLAKRVGMEYLHIDPLKIDFGAVTEVMSSAYATRFRVLPVALNTKEAVVATAEPGLREWEPEVARMIKREIKRVIANPLDIERYQVEFYNLAKSMKGAKATVGGASGLSNFEQLVELGKTDKQLDANDAHVVRIVDWLWQYAFEQRASDIHVEPRREHGVVRFRIDGVLHQVYQIPAAVLAAMTSRIKILARMDVVEKRRPQDGRIKTRTGADDIELRISTLPTAFGEKLVMRIFDPEVLVRDFSELGFSDEDQKRWKDMTERPNGIVLVTGPTGSGKTTTLYSTLKALATPEVNVCTIEDPIEMVEPAFNQMQVQSSIDLGFAEGVRALMRQDPDIIMVGEIRDLETADIAIKAAQTGHMVMSTLHTNDAPTTLTRLLNMGVAPFNVASSVILITAQRLARRLCENCKQPADYPREAMLRAGYKPEDLDGSWRPYRAVGCSSCSAGYRGRVGIYQVMPITEEQQRIILSEGTAMDIAEQARKDGVRDLRQSGLVKVKLGVTTLEEVIAVTNE
jgi:general secretion pathway protein E